MNVRMAVVACAVSLAGSAWAQDTAVRGELKEALALPGNAERGKQVFESCDGCHGKNAEGRTNGVFPRLAGQHRSVLVKQLVDIRSGARNNPTMKPIIAVGAITVEELADVASFLQSLPFKGAIGKGPGSKLEMGRQLYDKDCANCHGKQGEGQAAKFYPMVAAQHYRYLLRELVLIKGAERRNSNAEMVERIEPYGTEEMEAVSDYMSRLPPVR